MSSFLFRFCEKLLIKIGTPLPFGVDDLCQRNPGSRVVFRILWNCAQLKSTEIHRDEHIRSINFWSIQSSFPVINKGGKVGIFEFLKFENKLDMGIKYFNISSKYHHKCKFALKLIPFLTICNIFLLEVVYL